MLVFCHIMEHCKTLFMNTPQVWEMYKGIRKRKRIYKTLPQTNVKISQNLSMSKMPTVSRLYFSMSKTDRLQ
jgi:hypothetical protein